MRNKHVWTLHEKNMWRVMYVDTNYFLVFFAQIAVFGEVEVLVPGITGFILFILFLSTGHFSWVYIYKANKKVKEQGIDVSDSQKFYDWLVENDYPQGYGYVLLGMYILSVFFAVLHLTLLPVLNQLTAAG